MKKKRVTLQPHTHPAFSLVEFIVIISIFAIMAGIALFNYSGFNATVSVSNLAHDIALTIRQSQVYGISAEAGVDDFNTGQISGVYFQAAPNGGFDPTFIVYNDAHTPVELGASVLQSPVEYIQGTDVVLDQVTITTNDRITDIATGSSMSSLTVCQQDVVIAFMRPNPDAYISCGGAPNVGYAQIKIVSANGNNVQYVEVWPTGQIGVTHQVSTQ